MSFIARLHVITDTQLQNNYSHLELAEMAFRAGADAVQYRNKNFIEARDLPELLQLSRSSKLHNKFLIVNDRADLALKVNAEGAHIGKGDGNPAEVRKLLGEKRILGITAHTIEEAREAERQGADYIGVGPVFGSSSKNTGLLSLGIDGLSRIVEAVKIPVIAIGGITSGNVDEILGAGAHGAAVLSAVCCAKNPERETGLLAERIRVHPANSASAGH